MLDEEFTLGLGALVLEAGHLEYNLHGLMSHLLCQERAYGQRDSGAPAAQHIKAAEEALKKPDPRMSDKAREVLLADLKACSRVLDKRNTFIHSCWTFDKETYQWWGVKANRKRSGTLMYTPCDSDSPGELVEEIAALSERLLEWDIQLFGEAGDPEEGQPPRVSVKRS